MNARKLFSLVLSLLIIFVSLRVIALSGSFTYNKTTDGVSACCSGSLSINSASTSINLAFIPNINHFPEEDYSCDVGIELIIGGNRYVGIPITPGNMNCSFSTSFSGTVTYADFSYVVNHHNIYHKYYQ